MHAGGALFRGNFFSFRITGDKNVLFLMVGIYRSYYDRIPLFGHNSANNPHARAEKIAKKLRREPKRHRKGVKPVHGVL